MRTLLERLPTIVAFPTVDAVTRVVKELARAHPDRASVQAIGVSRDGEPIHLLTLMPTMTRGSVLVIGQPHPNEPIGMATITSLASLLVEDPGLLDALGVTWHFVPCADPDATRLNEGWFAGPFTREHYARHFFRPAPDQQVEWTFPFEADGFRVDAPMPETQALMRAIDISVPTVLTSLHNGELGGAYFYASANAPEVYEHLTRLCTERDIPLHLGEPEVPIVATLHPAVFEIPTAGMLYDYCTGAGIDPALAVSGGNSLDYARGAGDPFGIVIELPYWRDTRAGDTTDTSPARTRREVILNGIDAQQVACRQVREILDTAGALTEPFASGVAGFLLADASGQLEVERAQVASDDAYIRTATVAEEFSTMSDLHSFRLRLGGMLLRAVPEDTTPHAEAERLFAGWVEAAGADGEPDAIPIRDLVAVQAGAILAAVAHAHPRASVGTSSAGSRGAS